MRRVWITLTLFFVGALSSALRAQSQATSHTPEWSYEGANGPEHWGELDAANAACASGKEQSPIDIRDAKKGALPRLQFEYKSTPLKIVNNGHTVRVNFAPGNGNFLIVGDKRYELVQFHFHRPSEEQIKGKQFAMVAHLVHKADDGKLAVVAVLLKAGSANMTLQQIWDHMPMTEGPEQQISDVEFNPSGLLPANAAYFTFAGSLTTPPCTEGLTWFVLRTPTDVSHEQIDAFAKLYPHNARPIQPLNGRVVTGSR
jgi:carbonic anhydrase